MLWTVNFPSMTLRGSTPPDPETSMDIPAYVCHPPLPTALLTMAACAIQSSTGLQSALSCLSQTSSLTPRAGQPPGTQLACCGLQSSYPSCASCWEVRAAGCCPPGPPPVSLAIVGASGLLMGRSRGRNSQGSHSTPHARGHRVNPRVNPWLRPQGCLFTFIIFT